MRNWSRRFSVVSLGLFLLVMGLPSLTDMTQAGPRGNRRQLPGDDQPSGGGPPRQELDAPEAMLIRAEKPYAGLVSTVESLGGTVTHQFQCVDAIAAQIPRSQLAALGSLLGGHALVKDSIIPQPKSMDSLHGRTFGMPAIGDPSNIGFDSVSGLDAAGIQAVAATPDAYTLNNSLINVDQLHADGFAGQGVIVE